MFRYFNKKQNVTSSVAGNTGSIMRIHDLSLNHEQECPKKNSNYPPDYFLRTKVEITLQSPEPIN